MAALDEATAARALGLGVVLGGANPKNFVLSAAAAASIAESGVDDADLGVAIAVFVLVGSCTVLGAVAARLVGGRRGESLLDSLRGFMVANGSVITAVVFLLLGAKVLGDGLGGLGR
jgi:hypothetical protein